MSGEAVSGLTGSGAEPLEDEDPRRIGPIPLLGRLGAGGMGRVYLGVHEGRYAAVKQVLPSVVAEDKDFLRRFGHELDNLARLPEEATAPLLAGDRDARPRGSPPPTSPASPCARPSTCTARCPPGHCGCCCARPPPGWRRCTRWTWCTGT